MRADEREIARRLYQPDLDAMRACLPDLGAALDAALCDLSRDSSLDSIDRVLMKLDGVKQSLVAMRRATAENERPSHGTG